MFLEKLIVRSNQGIIRDIPFNLQGLNLILDTTPITQDNTVSGNNVGKTTFIRSIDFCFGSSGKDIYQDKETKTDNEEVKHFLIDSQITFELSLIGKNNIRYLLKRSFSSEEDLVINGIQYSKLSDYNEKLCELLFHISPNETKLSFRHLIKKFVRSDIHSEGNLYRILHHFAKDSVYEALYLFLFGFPEQDIITKRLKIIDETEKKNKELKRIRGKSSLPKLQNRLFQLQKLIEEKEELIKHINLPKTYDELITRLKEVKTKTGGLSSNLGNLNIKISLSQKTKNELIHSQTNIDPKAIEQLY
ncbi:MAG: hypothetical protein WCF67_17950, partial [Chitinophagaceae bacterium]